MNIVLSNLQSQIYHLYRTIDDYELTTPILQVAPKFLGEFSYAKATEFKSEERRLINEIYDKTRLRGKNITDLMIPEEAWDKFWLVVDANKGTILTKMQQYSNSSRFLYYTLYEDYVRFAFHDPSGTSVVLYHLPWYEKSLISRTQARYRTQNGKKEKDSYAKGEEIVQTNRKLDGRIGASLLPVDIREIPIKDILEI